MPTTTARPARTAGVGDVFAALYAGHQLGDHVAQTDHQATHKADQTAKGWQAMAGHIATYTACQVAALVVTAATGTRINPRRAALGLALSAATHAFIDRRWPVQRLLTATGAPGFAALASHGINGAYLTNQALHTGVLLAAAALTTDQEVPT